LDRLGKWQPQIWSQMNYTTLVVTTCRFSCGFRGVCRDRGFRNELVNDLCDDLRDHDLQTFLMILKVVRFLKLVQLPQSIQIPEYVYFFGSRLVLYHLKRD
jgi:hypothetical protein